MHTPWYLEPEARQLLTKIAIEGIDGTRHVKGYAGGGRDTWVSYDETVAGKRLNELHSALFTNEATREDIIAKGGCVCATDAIQFALGYAVSDRCADCPADFAPILAATQMKEAA